MLNFKDIPLIIISNNPKGGWDVIKSDENKLLYTITQKEDAVAYASAFCRYYKCELHILDLNGNLEEKKEF